MAKLNKRQKAFVDYYITTLNATESAIKAGYSKKTARQMGYENLTKPYIQAEIEKCMASKDKERIMSQDEVLERMTEVARDPDNPNYLRALENMGKRHGTFVERVEQTITADVSAEVNLSHLSTDEIRELLEHEDQE